MLRSLFAGISGLRVNQTALDVTGNNIANANTAGFKSSQIVFQDTLSQMLTGATAPANNDPGRGGTNPMQVGLGVQVGGINTNFGQGSAQMTNRPTDLMVQGDGFFVIERAGIGDFYTRAGAFNFDAAGNLVTVDGDKVKGWTAGAGGALPPVMDGTNDAPFNINDAAAAANPGGTLLSYSIGTDGVVTGVFDNQEQPVTLGRVATANFVNPQGLEKAGDSLYRATNNSGGAEIGGPGEGGRGTLVGGAIEMSNVDLAQEFTNLIIAQRGFQASSRVITTSDQVLEELVNIKR
jgi:flagellar hook protein FlgE